MRSAVRTERNGPSTTPTTVPAGTCAAIVLAPLDRDVVVDLCEHLGGACRAGEDAVGADDDVADRPGVRRQERGGDVTVGTEVFGDRTRDDVADDVTRRVERGGRVVHDTATSAGSGTNDGRPSAPNTKRPRNASSVSG